MIKNFKNTAIHLTLALHKGRPIYRRSLQRSKENQHCKRWNLLTVLYFSGSFLPPGSGSATMVKSMDQNRICCAKEELGCILLQTWFSRKIKNLGLRLKLRREWTFRRVPNLQSCSVRYTRYKHAQLFAVELKWPCIIPSPKWVKKGGVVKLEPKRLYYIMHGADREREGGILNLCFT